MFPSRWASSITVLLLLSRKEYSEGVQIKLPTRAPNSINVRSTEYDRELLSPQQDDHDMQEFPDPVMTRSLFFASAAALIALPAAAQAFPLTTKSTLENIAVGGSVAQDTSQQLSASSELSSFQESISGFVAGGALAAIKTVVKFPLDTATVRLQMPNSDYSLREIFRLFNGSYNGLTLSLLSNIPGGAIFFAVKDATKASLKNSALSTAPKWATTSLAVAAALIPYWLIRNPSEVIKVRQQAGIEGYGEGVSAIEAVKSTLNESNGTVLDGIQEFYTGYGENIIYGFPADVIKFVAYEAATNGRRDLTPFEGAQAGAFATALAQLVTTPLDVIRNRLMTGKSQNGVSLTDEEKGKNYFQSLVTLGREEGLNGLFAGASPRVAKAFLSGAIQFATYEETKQSIARLLQR
jgi:solute carrier family 25 S-adenosylmethionine transporter 26